MLEPWCFEVPRKPHKVNVSLQTHMFASKVKRLGKWELDVLVWVFFVGLVLFFLPSNRVICKNNQYDVLPLCEWSGSEGEDLAVCSCVALRTSVSLYSNAVQVPHVLFRWSYLGEWGPSSETIALNWVSLNIVHICPKFGDCFIKSVWTCVCVHTTVCCSTAELLPRRIAAQKDLSYVSRQR